MRVLTISANVSDFRPLTGMPLESLRIFGGGNNTVADLSPLAGLPLKDLNIVACKEIKGFTPLLRVPTLERLATQGSPASLAPLRQHPKLAFIDYKGKGYRPAAEVWAEMDAKKADGK